MREKFDKKFKYYFSGSVVLGTVLLMAQFAPIIKPISIILNLLFVGVSVWAIVHFVRNEYHKQSLIIPIYYIMLSTLYYSLIMFGITRWVVYDYSTTLGIIFSVVLIGSGLATLIRYRRDNKGISLKML